MRYLEFCVNEGNSDPSIHNYLLSRYALLRDDGPLLRFLKGSRGRGLVDLQYALRVSTQHRQTKACIFIYSKMGLYEEAVRMALGDDISLAKENANLPEDREMRKRLWLMIARHIIEDSSSDIKESIHVLEECPLLSIEDVLPFFPDFVVIDAFKTEICAKLEEYNRNIEGLKSEIEDYTESAENIRKEIGALNSTPMHVSCNTKCAISGAPILSGPFYVFSSGYAILADVLMKHVLPHLSESQRQRAKTLHDWLEQNPSAPVSERDFKQAEFDGLIAAECPLTGELMIQSIDRPLISPDADTASWQV